MISFIVFSIDTLLLTSFLAKTILSFGIALSVSSLLSFIGKGGTIALGVSLMILVTLNVITGLTGADVAVELTGIILTLTGSDLIVVTFSFESFLVSLKGMIIQLKNI